MAYAFDPHDGTLDQSLRRIATEELSAAAVRCGRLHDPRAVHGVRKNLKKTRALLRLVRYGLPERSAANGTLRELAAALSVRRDTAVRLATFDRLFPDPPPMLRVLRGRLLEESIAPADVPAEVLVQSLTSLRDEAGAWQLRGKSRHILTAGLARTRRDAIAAADAARRTPDAPEAIHAWRKRVKDLWYQSRLFAPVWPELFQPLGAAADRLGEELGLHNDLSVLSCYMAALPESDLPEPARELLATAIHDAQSAIRTRAFPLSDRLLAGSPRGVARLWVDLHGIWRRGA